MDFSLPTFVLVYISYCFLINSVIVIHFFSILFTSLLLCKLARSVKNFLQRKFVSSVPTVMVIGLYLK